MILDRTLPYLLHTVAKENEDSTVFHFKNENQEYITWTYGDFLYHINHFALSLNNLGAKRGDKIFLLLDNCKEWAVADLACMSLGIITVPRGSDVPDQDLQLFINHTESNIILFNTESDFERLKELNLLSENKILISIQPLSKEITGNYKVYSFDELIELGANLPGEKDTFLLEEINKAQVNDIVTIIYTSGTSGNPKGVCLCHKTFTFQLQQAVKIVPFRYKKETTLSILPIWHSYERIIQYFIFYLAGCIAYSKPIGKVFLEDIKKIHPTILPAVPRLFESLYHGVMNKVKKQKIVSRGLFKFFYGITSIYNSLLDFNNNNYFNSVVIPTFIKLFFNIFSSIGLFLLYPLQLLGYLLVFRKINKAFGKKLRFVLSAGAHLPLFIDKFFRIIKINIIEGYGMTEFGPLVAARVPYGKMGTTSLLPGVEFYLQDEKGNRNEKKGELFIYSPQNMLGYYKNPETTSETIINGYIRTGDIMQMDNTKAMRMIGRSKNVVVLANGENVETEPLEVCLSQNPYIAYSLIVGNDEKFLGALIIPNFVTLEEYAKSEKIVYENRAQLCKNPKIYKMYKEFIQTHINKSKEFSHTPIVEFCILNKEFQINKEVTATFKLKRTYVQKHYFREIQSLYYHK